MNRAKNFMEKRCERVNIDCSFVMDPGNLFPRTLVQGGKLMNIVNLHATSETQR